MRIVTARLSIDDLQVADAAALHAYRADPEVARYQGWNPSSVDEVVRFIEAQQHVAPDTPGSWWQRALRRRDDGALVGDLGLHFLADATVELGISIAPAAQRHGYAREVLELALDFSFGGLHKHRVTASVDPRNTPCVRLLESVGMRREAHFRASVRSGDGWADDFVYALLEREWLAAADAEDR